MPSSTVHLREFRGCYEKTIGGELEDCHLTFSALAPELLDWIADTLQGIDVRRNITVHALTQAGMSVSRLQIQNAFVRDITVSELSADGQQDGTITLIVVPGTIQSASGGGSLPGAVTGPRFRESGFSLRIGSDDISLAARISSVRARLAKLVTTGPSGVEYYPGAPVFDDLQVEVMSNGAGALDTWVDSVRSGANPFRAGEIVLRDSSLAAVARVPLFDLAPIAFPQFGTTTDRRTILLDVGRFEITPP